jgi:predicted DNA binding CopG/RHH family protein
MCKLGFYGNKQLHILIQQTSAPAIAAVSQNIKKSLSSYMFTIYNHFLIIRYYCISMKNILAKKKLPTFKIAEEETKFWEQNDSIDYIDWGKAKLAIFPNLKPSATTISLRLPEALLNEIKILAHKEDIPYQSLIKIMLAHEVSLKRNLTRR